MALRALDIASVHRLCSSQVIVSLQTAVKELIENSLDAGATRIEILLRNYGSELIEVSDNGSGVESSNFEGLTKRHATSKLKDFSDLSSVSTLGFRGEALSSLCALSQLSLVTRHKSQPHATKIEFDSEGKIVRQTHHAREVGTTVTLENVFYSLPVRHREFLNNLKKEYGKMTQVLQGHCLINVGVRITCTHQTSLNGRKQVVLSNGPSQTVKDNIACVFGAKEVAHLVELEQCSVQDLDTSERESWTDVHLPETWPFRLTGYISKCQHGCGRTSPDRQYYYINQRPVDLGKLAKTVNDVYHLYNKHQFPVIVMDIETERERVDVNLTPDKREVMIQQEKLLLLLAKYSLIMLFNKTNHVAVPTCSQQKSHEDVVAAYEVSTGMLLKRFASSRDKRNHLTVSSSGPRPAKRVKTSSVGGIQQHINVDLFSPDLPNARAVSPESGITMPPTMSSSYLVEVPHSVPADEITPQAELKAEDDFVPVCVSDSKVLTVKCNIKMIRKRLGIKSATTGMTGLSQASVGQFGAEISPDANQVALQELQREFQKESFRNLEVIGQFNLGFIIAKLDKDLFIIDQHASDEKYNFERLQKTTQLCHQKLVIPKRLQLSAANEILLQDHIDTFSKNGFTFSFDSDAEPGQRVNLTGIPISRNWSFGAEDVDEMLFLLSNSSTGICRPSRVTAMFASRACRSSVMIGTPLNKQSMEQILLHMAELDQPWNCPHGRPTMRHLVNFSHF